MDGDEDEGEAEGDVADDDGGEAEAEVVVAVAEFVEEVVAPVIDDGEEDEEADAHDDVGHDEGDGDEGAEEAGEGPAVAIEEPCAEGAEEDGEDRDGGGDEEAVEGGGEEGVVVEDFVVPVGGEALPDDVEAGGVEGINDQESDGEIEEGEHKGGPEAEKGLDALHSGYFKERSWHGGGEYNWVSELFRLQMGAVYCADLPLLKGTDYDGPPCFTSWIFEKWNWRRGRGSERTDDLTSG